MMAFGDLSKRITAVETPLEGWGHSSSHTGKDGGSWVLLLFTHLITKAQVFKI